jgi:hypothetical protein
MTVGGLADTVFCFSRPCACHLYTAPRNNNIIANCHSNLTINSQIDIKLTVA